MRKLRIFILSIFLLLPVFASARAFYGEFSISNQLLWRGMQWTPSPLIYPTLGFEARGFNVYTTAAYAFDDSYREWDFGLSYTIGCFKLEVIDYFYPALSSEPNPDKPRYDFFNWNNATTGHQIDCIIWFTPKSVPIKAMASVLPFGYDKLPDGSNAFSTYAELGWYHNFENDSRIEANLGACFMESPIYLTKGFGVVNIETKYSKTFALKSIRFPLGVSFVFNPYAKKPYIVASAGISF